MDERPRPSGEDADDLRRRLYRPDATDVDLQRYLAGRSPATGQHEPLPARTARPRRRPAVFAVAPILVAAVFVAIALTRPGLIETPAPSLTAAAPTDPPLLVDDGDGQVLVVDTTTVRGPTRIATSMRGTPVVGERFSGSGDAAVTLDPPAGTQEAGRALVALSAAGTSPVEWRALLLVSRADWSTYPVVMARGNAGRASVPVPPTTFAYRGLPPTRITVAAPAGVRWELVVAIVPGGDPGPR